MVESLMYKQKRVFIATRHNKEQVIAPLFQQVFDAKPFVSSFINTDQFGTFTREIERRQTPIETLRKKCLYGSRISQCDLVIASEGSFGAHPSIPFTQADEEILMFKDFSRDVEVVGKYLSTETNNYQNVLSSLDDLDSALEIIGFPDHGIILRNLKDDEIIVKGLDDETRIRKYVSALLKDGQRIQIESDMRAIYNPTRMKIIELAAHDLVNNIQSLCPVCKTPGFVVKEAKPGLPCSSCGMPTKSVKYQVKICHKCKNEEKVHYPFGKKEEEPMYCEFCNP